MCYGRNYDEREKISMITLSIANKIYDFIGSYGVILRNIFTLIILVLFFLFLRLVLFKKKNKVSLSMEKRKKIMDIMSENIDKRASATKEERTIMFLSRYGVNYRFKRIVRPGEYTAVSLLFAFIFAILALVLSIGMKPVMVVLIVAAAGFVGSVLPGLYFRAANAEDNKKMLTDIHAIYDTLRVYLKAGTFITEALDECYYRVGNKRLKTALFELKEGIRAQKSKDYEVNSFHMKFNNVYIDILVNILEQYFSTGSVATLLDDVTEQMVDIDHAINIREKEKLDTRIFFKTILVYVGLIAGIAVAILFNLKDSLWGMFG